VLGERNLLLERVAADVPEQRREGRATTSAAPTYFPPHRAVAAVWKSYTLIDGGVYANNPALCAWVEAHARHPEAEILVVSLGTGNENKTGRRGPKGASYARILDLSPSAVTQLPEAVATISGAQLVVGPTGLAGSESICSVFGPSS